MTIQIVKSRFIGTKLSESVLDTCDTLEVALKKLEKIAFDQNFCHIRMENNDFRVLNDLGEMIFLRGT